LRRGFLRNAAIAGAVLVAVALICVAFVLVEKLQEPSNTLSRAATELNRIAAKSPEPVPIPVPPAPIVRPAPPPPLPPPQLVVAQAAPASTDEARRLDISLSRATEGASLLVGGLPPGAAVSAGRPSGSKWWRLSQSELEGAVVTPPHGFAGSMDLVLELRLADASLADHKTLRLEWLPPTPTEPTPAEPAFVPRRLDPGEIEALLEHGQQSIAKGDLAAARALFQRAAEAGDAIAAFALAETYDPIALKRLGEQGFAPDIAMARTWYERAQKFGSNSAAQRLQTLENLNR
jgi:hypothetical protein